LKTNGVRRTIFRIVSVHAQDNGLGVSGAELERSARYQDLLYARTVIGCHRSHRNRPRGLWHTRQEIRRSRGVSKPHENIWWPPGRISSFRCTTFIWPS